MIEPAAVASDKPWDVIPAFMGRRIVSLQRAILNGEPTARAQLAQLRRCDPTRDDRIVEAWSVAFSDVPEELLGAGDTPSDAERALAATLHLYAMHQQSKSAPMHVRGESLGRAIRRLARPELPDSQEKAVMRRYQALVSTTEFSGIIQYIRGLVSQFRYEGIALDYVKLAVDLYFVAQPSTRTRVRLAWARDVSKSLPEQHVHSQPNVESASV